MRWHEVERVVDDIHVVRRAAAIDSNSKRWSKARWEAEWESGLSRDVARRLREGTLTERNVRRFGMLEPGEDEDDEIESRYPLRGSCLGEGGFDPLHLPSLFMFSLSLLGPLRGRVGRSFSSFVDALGELPVRLALFGGLCVGLGIGLFLKA